MNPFRRYLRKQKVRDVIVAAVLAAVFLTTGSCTPPWIAHMIGGAPFNLDLSLRALAAGWYPTERTVPVTIVDIDEKTQIGWGRPPTTPRVELARLIAGITVASPRAVIVDIDLSYGATAKQVDPGRAELRRFLARYNQPSRLVFSKRVVRDSLDRYVPAVSDLDDLIGTRPNLTWADASFVLGNDGATRDWNEWIDVCIGERTQRLPSIAMVVTANEDSLRRQAADTTSKPCNTSKPPPTHRVLVGPRMTGPTRIASTKVQAIPARVLLDPRQSPNATALFANRIVLIGATHQDAGDFWVTPLGVIPGVELLANIIHYASFSLGDVPSTRRFRITTVVVFLALALGTARLAGIATVVAVTGGMLLLVAVAVGVLEWFWFFDAVAAALTLVLSYEAIRACIAFMVRVGEEQRRPNASPGRWRAIGRACLRKPDESKEATTT